MSEILFEKYKDYFRVGAAISGIIYDEDFNFFGHKPPQDFVKSLKDGDIAKKHFNLFVAENDTKMQRIYTAEDTYDFSRADKFIKFAKESGKDIRWHTLVWHNQSPQWIFEDGKGGRASKQQLAERTRKYIMEVGKRYSDVICSVDVVNECISDKKFNLRTEEDHSLWQEILGPDYVDNAFIWAKEAFPKSSLVLNDYNLEVIPGKRQGFYELVKGMKERGIPVDTVGLQMHINIEDPAVEEIEKTIELYGNLGLNVIVTEMDVSVYTQMEEAKKDITQEILDRQAERYYKIFECFKKEAKNGILKDVIFWGVTDALSWKNNFPVRGRGDAPLLFDNKGNEKPAFAKLIK